MYNIVEFELDYNAVEARKIICEDRVNYCITRGFKEFYLGFKNLEGQASLRP